MSVIEKTEAVVVRSVDVRETSKIVTFYTRKSGKISGIVKGARRSKNQYGSSLEPMSYVSIVYYSKESRDVQTISSCDIVKPFRRISEDIDKMAVGMSIVELLNNVTPERHENSQLFSLLINTLTGLNIATKNTRSLFYYFEYHLARCLGFSLQFNNCIYCNKQLEQVLETQIYNYSIERGGLVCSKCVNTDKNKVQLKPEIVKIFREIISSNNIDLIMELEISEMGSEFINNFLWTYLKYHVANLRPLKAQNVFEKII
jgi:DNA repair protein RecO (recombination protein O)